MIARAVMLFFFALLLAVGALADDAGDDAALAGFKRSQAAYEAARYEEALAGFRDVERQLDSPNARLYIARCLYGLGRLPEAYDEMSATVRQATERARSEPRFAPTRDAAIEELAEIEAKVGRVSIIAPSAPDGLSVRVGDRAIRGEELGSAVSVFPGALEVVAAAPGYRPFTKKITVAPGSIETVTLELEAEGAAPRTSGFGVREGGIIVAGVGVAGMVTFIVAGVIADDTFDEVSDACGGNHCPDPSRDGDIEEGRRLDIVANVGLGVGIAGLVAGGLMIILGWPDSGSEAAVVPTHDGIALEAFF